MNHAFFDTVLACCFLASLTTVNALGIHNYGVQKPSVAMDLARVVGELSKRADVSSPWQLNNTRNTGYFIKIRLGDQSQEFSVMVDTGSTDLWVAGPVNGSSETGKYTGFSFATGSVNGPIKTATLNLQGYSIPNQAFLEVNTSDVQDMPAGIQGIIGLGPTYGSAIRGELGGSVEGDPPVDSIFRQNTSTPNFISFMLGRADVGVHSFPGEFMIGMVQPGYEAVQQAPKLPTTSDDYWTVLLDKDGIIGPDGKVISFTSNVQNATDGRAVVKIDTGYAFPQVPSSVAEAIYSHISGAQMLNSTSTNSNPTWYLPCDAELNISFKFGGQTFPVHPIDTSMNQNLTGDDGSAGKCTGMFQPASFSSGEPQEFDMIFGTAFLRNAYVLINFGNFVDGSHASKDAPYVQMLSTTNDSALAHQEFVDRVNFIHTEAQKAKRNLIIIVIACIAALVLLGVFIRIGMYYARRNNPKPTMNSSGARSKAGAYRQLHEPAPDMDLQVMAQTVGPVPGGQAYHDRP